VVVLIHRPIATLAIDGSRRTLARGAPPKNAGTIRRNRPSFCRTATAISRPSGDHVWLSTAPATTTGTGSPPSIAWTKMRIWFCRSEMNDSHRPSGDTRPSDSALGHVTAGSSALDTSSSSAPPGHWR
jgi:hypothetical protein